jgi:hypothetical protein
VTYSSLQYQDLPLMVKLFRTFYKLIFYCNKKVFNSKPFDTQIVDVFFTSQYTKVGFFFITSVSTYFVTAGSVYIALLFENCFGWNFVILLRGRWCCSYAWSSAKAGIHFLPHFLLRTDHTALGLDPTRLKPGPNKATTITLLAPHPTPLGRHGNF